MSIKIKIDASSIASELREYKSQIEKEIQEGVKMLATAAHAKITEMAHSELHSSQKKYLEALDIQSISENIHVVTLDEKAFWIEDGIPENTDMKPALLSKNTKTSKDGNKYRSIPFEHSTGTPTGGSSSQNIVNQIKTALSKKNIPFKQIERHANGSPKLGKLHTIDVPSGKPGKGNTPQLQGVNIYQSMGKDSKVRRDVLTFRTVSSGPASSDKFIHPGTKAMNFFEKTEQWSYEQWENTILPQILKNYK